MTRIPDDLGALLTRNRTAEALTNAGFPTKAKTLATKATRGGGPPYQLFGARALYRWENALQWAESRLSAPRGSTSETDTTCSTDGSQLPRSEMCIPKHEVSNSERRSNASARSDAPTAKRGLKRRLRRDREARDDR